MATGPLILRGLGDVVAAVPHVLGAQVQESIVVFPTNPRLAPVGRVDLPDTDEQLHSAVEQLAAVYAQRATPVVLLAFTSRRDLAQAASEQLTRVFAASCPVIAAVTVHGDRWVRIDRPEHGTVTTAVRDRVAVESIYRDGAAPYRSLAEHRQSFDPGASVLSGETMRQAQTVTAGLRGDAGALAQEQAWFVLTVARHVAAGTSLSDPDAARLLADIQDVGLRDLAWAGIVRADAARHGEFWKDLLTRAPDGLQAPAASLAAFSYWIAGDGMSARAALERVPAGLPYPLAGLLETALRTGIDPNTFPVPDQLPPDPTPASPSPSPGRRQERHEPPPVSTDRPPGVSR